MVWMGDIVISALRLTHVRYFSLGSATLHYGVLNKTGCLNLSHDLGTKLSTGKTVLWTSSQLGGQQHGSSHARGLCLAQPSEHKGKG